MGDLVVYSDLKKRFAEFGEIETTTRKLQEDASQINAANVAAGGTSDEVATTYHGQVDKPTSQMTDLIGQIAQMFGVTGQKGGATTDVFQAANEDSTQYAQGL